MRPRSISCLGPSAPGAAEGTCNLVRSALGHHVVPLETADQAEPSCQVGRSGSLVSAGWFARGLVVPVRVDGQFTEVFSGAGGVLRQAPGRCTKPRMRWAALSTAITKHMRSGPRLGNGAPVYLTEIGSI
jgi:hypothetical protein